MKGDPALPVGTPPPHLQPLSELPALLVADAGRDVRGREIRADDGRVLGVVSDLLADPDRLVVEFLLVAPSDPGAATSIVPIGALAARRDYLVVGSGLEPIELRYRSTLRLTAWAIVLAAVFLLLLWLLGTAAC